MTLEQRLESAGLLEEVLEEFAQAITRSAVAGLRAGEERGFINGVEAAIEFATPE